eukprot:CAMPEP_0181243516 /NCGR_PEP_ID=MMETSP1096-20121128/42319_1 /TAXON_ID=156174 ORGANISM="Chrysochromulina ericina, Strain CCMP281" /NCGR_SAMPLE_ID=MMETSP1096 /ASSEMBLY_ACC=CAM_ASM_000453 /LENGTH=469 /DNA_ID=CAMNT_0023339905 /DNA_START=60 /DNA_END=1470 /DNA_ORIENTATION=-
MPPMLPHLQQHRGPQQPPPPLHQPQMLPLPQQLQARGGVIFLCDPQTEDECLHRGLFGMPASQMQIVRQIAPEASLLYLFNVRTRLMSGIFRATSWPQLNLEPSAWGEGSAGSSRYPLQVRVRLETEHVLQVGEDSLRSLLEYRGSHNRFDLQLSNTQAEALARLFGQHGQLRQPVTAVGLGHVPYMPRIANLPVHLRAWGSGGARGGGGGGGGGERQWKNGVIFICDPSTEQECISRRLLGLPKSQSSLLSKLGDSSYLFLFNVRSRQLLGIFQPEGPAGMDLEPNAWGGGRFPVQVRFRLASPSGVILSLPEAALGDVLRYRNATARFDLLLRAKALDKLVALFAQYGTPVSAGSSRDVPLAISQPHEIAWQPQQVAQSSAMPQLLPQLPPQPPLPPLPPAMPGDGLASLVSPASEPVSKGGRAAPEDRAGEERPSRPTASETYPQSAAAPQLEAILGGLTLDPPIG